MRCIIAGSRDLEADKDHFKVWLVADAIQKSGFKDEITEVVSGGARGIDIAGEIWASAFIPPIQVKHFIPDWNKYGKGAGFIRNAEMAKYADALVLVWNGTSRGSADMLKQAKLQQAIRPFKIYEYIVK